MSVSDWVPIASVVATAVVGLGVPIVSSRFDREKIRDQADEGRRDELREVIDEAGAHLTETIYALDDAVWRGRESARADMDEDAGAIAESINVDGYEERVKKLWTYENRIAVRVGSADDLHARYAEATRELGKAISPLSAIKSGAEFDRDRSRELTDARSSAFTAQSAFHDAAARRVGLKRPK